MSQKSMTSQPVCDITRLQEWPQQPLHGHCGGLGAHRGAVTSTDVAVWVLLAAALAPPRQMVTVWAHFGGLPWPGVGGCSTQGWWGLSIAMAPSIAPHLTHLPPKTRDRWLVALPEVH